MAYYDRQEQLNRTMASIRKSAITDYEVIIVDDASPVPVVCEGAKIIRIEPKDKWYHNPCIPFNLAFKHATGNIIIIQNPDCMHSGDILLHAYNNAKSGTYLSYGCYAINKEETEALRKGIYPSVYDKRFGVADRNGWYNNATHRPVGYHFCCAITRKDLDIVGGFDERYAHGISFDDDDLVYRINDKGIKINIINRPFVIHQYHTPFTYNKAGWKELHAINKKLFKETWL